MTERFMLDQTGPSASNIANPDSGYVFTTERGTPFTADAINRLVKVIGARAELPFPVHFHMLRHSCGYALANRPPFDHAYGSLHRVEHNTLQGLLAMTGDLILACW